MKYYPPGPSELYPTIKQHINDAIDNEILSISHRSEEYKSIHRNAVDNLRKLMNIPDTYRIYFLSSATEAMERIIQNCVEKSCFHLVNGAFSEKFFSIARELGKNPQKHEVAYGEGFDCDKIQVSENAEVICVTHNETSTGVEIDPSEISRLKDKYPDKLVVVDAVSSAPIVDLNINKIDCLFFSVQKCFGLPSGLGVLIVSPDAYDKSISLSKSISIGSYHSFPSLEKKAVEFQTQETPNVLGIYLLSKVTEDMLKLGIDAIRSAIKVKTNKIYSYFQNKKGFELFVKNQSHRSNTVIVLNVENGSKEIVEFLKSKGMVVGKGYKDFKESQIRIANFPATTIEDVDSLLHVFDLKYSIN